ncbi:MAG: hypothetical protein ACK456_05360 [Pseudanabaenaceae cyanobacterium]|jgi:hypothetical protein
MLKSLVTKHSKLLWNIALILVFGALAISLQQPRLNKRIQGQTAEDDRRHLLREAANLNALRQLPQRGFGFNNVIAGYTFLQFLQYFGDDVARVDHGTGFHLSPQYFDIIVARDPRFINGYLYLSTSVSMFAAKPRHAISLYDLGLPYLSPKILPYTYTVWRRRATDQLLFLGDAAAARESYLKAAEAVESADFSREPSPLAEVPYIATWSRQSAQWLENNRDLRNAQIAGWSLVLQTASDKKTQQLVEGELDKLGITVVRKENYIELRPKK